MTGNRRCGIPKAKPGELKAAYGRVDGALDLCYCWGGSGASKPDSRILMRALEDTPIFEDRTLREELEARGYDVTTLKFSIRQKPAQAMSARQGHDPQGHGATPASAVSEGNAPETSTPQGDDQ